MNHDYDIKEQSQWLESLSVRPFDSKGVVLASKIAREVRKRSGVAVSLSGEKAVADLGKAVLQINEEDLNYLFRVLLDSVIKNHAQDDQENSGGDSFNNKNSKNKNSKNKSSKDNKGEPSGRRRFLGKIA